jgi:hypothetical protein
MAFGFARFQLNNQNFLLRFYHIHTFYAKIYQDRAPAILTLLVFIR